MHDYENSKYYDKGQCIQLTKRENIILDLLVKNKKQITTYNEIMQVLYNRGIYENHIKLIRIITRLRRKLKGLLNIYNKFEEGYVYMNIGKDNRHPKYICDKCGDQISYIGQKGFAGLNKYYKQKPIWDIPKRNFDLCDNCEKKFRKWLNTKELPTIEETINAFPQYEI